MKLRITPKKIAAAVVIVALLVGGGVYLKQRSDARAEEEARAQKADLLFVEARRECQSAGDLGDLGFTWAIDTEGEDDSSGDSLEELTCALDALDVPDAVRSHIASTRSIDGRQTDEWDRIEASWSYHPDSGMNIVFELEPATAGG